MAVSLPMTMTEFTDGKKANFRAAIAEVAGVSNAEVIIDKIESISTARSGGGVARRLLATGIRIDMHVEAADKNIASALGAKLTATAINAKLQQAGLPHATILEAPKTAASVNLSNASGAQESGIGASMLPAIIGAGIGLVVLSGIAVCLYLRCSKTKREPNKLDLASAELGTCPTSPAQTHVDARLGTSAPTTTVLCNNCGAMNEVSSKFCEDCHKQLHHKAATLFEQVTVIHIYFVY